VVDGNGAAISDFAISDLDDEADTDTDARIVKTKRFSAKPMDPEEAVLQMDLLGHDFFLFTNTETGHAALLYRRHDGHFGLIETSG
jgi:putative sigma-54 modulation protein